MTKKEKAKPKLWLIAIMLILIAAATVVLQLYLGNINWNGYFASKYEIKGADVSYYQGEIDWEILATQIDFAYIKATEGSYHVDTRFQENQENANAANMAIGAYHFFSFESSGKAQAENYIHTVGKWDGMLRPVVDVEFYATTAEIGTDEEIRQELLAMLEELEAYYGCKPIIYATENSYFRLLAGKFDQYPLWIRNIYFKPILWNRSWVFWQYEDSAVLEGYSGEQDKIDLNVFYATENEFQEYRISVEE